MMYFKSRNKRDEKILIKGGFEKIAMIIPPLELQGKFSETVRKNESLKQSMLTQSSALETQFQALMQKAFKGELV